MIIEGINYPEQISEALKNNKLVVFAGAGVSMGKPTCYPDFDQMTDMIAEGMGDEARGNLDCDVFLGRL